MTALLVIVWAFVGFVAAGLTGTELGPIFGFRHMEGSSAIFGMLVAAPVGAVLGGVFGFTLARRFESDPRRRRIALGAPVLAMALLAACGFLYETMRTWDWVDSNGGTTSIGYRVRLPADAASPAGAKIGVQLRSEKESPACTIYDYPHGLTQEGGRWLVSGDCPIRYATAKRVIAVRIGEGPNLLFRLRMQARPEVVPYSASAWYPVDEVQETAPGSMPRPPRPEEVHELLLSAR